MSKVYEQLSDGEEYMTPKQALDILIKTVQNNAICGRLSTKEREAIKILRNYFKEEEEND